MKTTKQLSMLALKSVRLFKMLDTVPAEEEEQQQHQQLQLETLILKDSSVRYNWPSKAFMEEH